MASYYYLMSSLPMIKEGGEMPFSYSEFLKICRPHVSDAKYEMLQNILSPKNKNSVFDEWEKFYGVFKSELDFRRNERLGKPAVQPYEREEKVTKAVLAAINEENPLTAEKNLLSLEFGVLDEIIGTHYFDDYALMGYALKLKLLERQSAFNREKGKAELDRLVSVLQQEIGEK